MSYTTYQTKAIVLAYENKGEANRLVTLFTEEFGLIRAMVQSVRKVQSKQRFGLQNFSLAHVNLIRGKEMWRLAGVESESNLGFQLAKSDFAYAIAVRTSKLVRRLIQGEEQNKELFAELHAALHFLVQQSLDQETAQYFETLLIVRTLYHLGYWANVNQAPWLVDAELSNEVLAQTAANHTNLIERVNASLRETQL